MGDGCFFWEQKRDIREPFPWKGHPGQGHQQLTALPDCSRHFPPKETVIPCLEGELHPGAPPAHHKPREEGPMDSEALEPDCPSSPFSFLNCQRLLPTHPQAQLGSLPCLTPDVLELTFCESVDCQGGSCSSAQNLKIQKSSNICNALSCITFLSSHQNSVAQPGKRINIQF